MWIVCLEIPLEQRLVADERILGTHGRCSEGGLREQSRRLSTLRQYLNLPCGKSISIAGRPNVSIAMPLDW